MADEIIDLSRFIERRAGGDAPAGTMALWGVDGERSRFALPLWRVLRLAAADRAMIFWRKTSGDEAPRPFVVLDVAQEPARIDVPEALAACMDEASAALHDHGRKGLLVCLGTQEGRTWGLMAHGGAGRPPLSSREREDILFLSGECAGLLFLWNFAESAEE